VIPNQRLIAASPTSIKVTLEVGSCWLAKPQALPPAPMAPTTS
jgi:hypothetical protein